MSMITEWVEEIFIFILSITFIEIMIPNGSIKKYVKFIFSLTILAVIIMPFSEIMYK